MFIQVLRFNFSYKRGTAVGIKGNVNIKIFDQSSLFIPLCKVLLGVKFKLNYMSSYAKAMSGHCLSARNTSVTSGFSPTHFDI